jgi:hypothetical protein
VGESGPQAATVPNAIRQVQSRDPRPDARRRRALVKVARVTRPTGGVRPTRLDKPFAHAPCVLFEKDAAKLGERDAGVRVASPGEGTHRLPPDKVTLSNDLWAGGWRWPRTVRQFIGATIFVGFYCVVLTGIAWAFWVDVAGVSSVALSLPLGILSGAALTFAVMFAFSRGWIVEGD